MTDILEDHEGAVSIGGRTITNPRFADDIDGLAGEEEELANLVERLDKATTAVLVNSSIGDWFGTTVGVLKGCLPSPTLFNIFLERIMTDTLEDHEGTVSIGGRTVTNHHFTDDIDSLAGEEEELANLVERLDKASTAYGMEISAKKTKLMTNNTM